MTRRSLVFALWISLVFASPQLLAKTSSIMTTGDDPVPTTESVGGDDQAPPSPKPASKPPAQNPAAKGKQQMQYRNPPAGKTAPRWHRFIPGMIR